MYKSRKGESSAAKDWRENMRKVSAWDAHSGPPDSISLKGFDPQEKIYNNTHGRGESWNSTHAAGEI